MGFLTRPTRRGMLAGHAALAGLAALPGGAALARNANATTDPSPSAAPARWHSATAEELARHVGERFRFSTAEHGEMVLRLVALEPGHSGPARPGDLPRREAVTAVFDSPDMAPLVQAGGGVARVSHPRIGVADLYTTATPRRAGGHHIEIVLN